MRRAPMWAWLFIGIACVTLVLMVFPMQGGKYTRGNACFSNIKQDVLALIMYATDSDDRVPARDAWMDSLEAYVKNDGIFHCPTIKDAHLYGYAFNAAVKTIDERPTMPMVYDSVNYGRNASDLYISLPVQGRHDGKNNVGMVDGHAKSLDPGAMKR